jgi:hypothetical protein
MDHKIPAELEARIAYYERPENDPGPLAEADWAVLVATGVLLPIVCLVLGWLVGWPS